MWGLRKVDVGEGGVGGDLGGVERDVIGEVVRVDGVVIGGEEVGG